MIYHDISSYFIHYLSNCLYFLQCSVIEFLPLYIIPIIHANAGSTPIIRQIDRWIANRANTGIHLHIDKLIERYIDR